MRTFQIELANTTPKSVVDALARELVKLDYELVATTLVIVLP